MVEHQSGTLNDLKDGETISAVETTDSSKGIAIQTTDTRGEQPEFAVGELPEVVPFPHITINVEDPDELVTPDLDTNDWMSQLREDEIFNGPKGPAPRLHGLRRLAKPFVLTEESKVNALVVVPKEHVIILETRNNAGDLMSSSEENAVWHLPMASVTFTIKLRDGRTFSDSADAYFSSCDDKLGLFPTAVASARAEARCLRKVLGVNQHAAEEFTNKDAGEELASNDDRPVKPEQAKLIDKMLEKATLSLKELLEEITTREVCSVEELTTGEARKALRILNNKKKKNKKAKKS